jgi:dienelactone hydrolase
MRACVAAVAAVLVAPAIAIPVPEHVEFPSLAEGVTVRALYFRPVSDRPVSLDDAARARGDDMTVTVYSGAYHAFDAPRGKTRVWKEVTTGANPDKGVTLGPNPAARDAATQAVRTFLKEHLQ